MKATRLLAACAALLAALLAGCGGGSSSGGDTPAPGSQTGTLTLSLTGGAPGPYRHAWVTVTAVALHTDAGRSWSPSDTSWTVFRLDTPKLVDLAASVNGTVASLLAGKSLPAATYGQMRLFVLRHDDDLTDVARQAGLIYNAQVEYVDTLGATRDVPLELADSALGLRLAGPLVITANVDNTIAVQWDLEHSIARFASDDGVDRVTLRPDLRWYDISQTGAIIGLVDKTLFCSNGATSGCIDEVVASAELPSADGRLMVSVRSAPVLVAAGDTRASFALYPLPSLPSGSTVDVVIRGRNMRTMIIRKVPASAADLLAANPTQLGIDMTDPNHPVDAPLAPMLSAQGDSQVSLNAATVPPSAQLLFAQTPPGSGALPHEIKVADTDPFTGRFAQPVSLPSGDLRVADYAANGVLVFTDTAPQEGSDGFSVLTIGTRYDDSVAIGTFTAPGGTSVGLTPPVTWRKANLDMGSLTVNFSGGSTQSADAAELVVSDVGGIVGTVDVSVLIGVAGAQTTVQLPAGANAAALGGTAVYSVAVRSWKRASPATSVTWERAPSLIDLRNASSASTTIALP